MIEKIIYTEPKRCYLTEVVSGDVITIEYGDFDNYVDVLVREIVNETPTKYRIKGLFTWSEREADIYESNRFGEPPFVRVIGHVEV